MSILITGMDMPKDGGIRQLFIFDDGRVYNGSKGAPLDMEHPDAAAVVVRREDDLISREGAMREIMSVPTDAYYPVWFKNLIEKLPAAVQPKKRWVGK